MYHLCFFSVVFAMPLGTSVYLYVAVTYWERAGLLALVCGVSLQVCHFPIGILGQVWYLVVSISYLCTRTYFYTLLRAADLSQNLVQPFNFFKTIELIQRITTTKSGKCLTFITQKMIASGCLVEKYVLVYTKGVAARRKCTKYETCANFVHSRECTPLTVRVLTLK